MTLTRWVPAVSSIIQIFAAAAILVCAGRALIALVQRKGIDRARLLLAEGVLAALGFSLAATLLNVIGLEDWAQIRTFAVVFVLRTVLKQVFVRERQAASAMGLM